jgi:hypothetical protein
MDQAGPGNHAARIDDPRGFFYVVMHAHQVSGLPILFLGGIEEMGFMLNAE